MYIAHTIFPITGIFYPVVVMVLLYCDVLQNINDDGNAGMLLNLKINDEPFYVRKKILIRAHGLQMDWLS